MLSQQILTIWSVLLSLIRSTYLLLSFFCPICSILYLLLQYSAFSSSRLCFAHLSHPHRAYTKPHTEPISCCGQEQQAFSYSQCFSFAYMTNSPVRRVAVCGECNEEPVRQLPLTTGVTSCEYTEFSQTVKATALFSCLPANINHILFNTNWNFDAAQQGRTTKETHLSNIT